MSTAAQVVLVIGALYCAGALGAIIGFGIGRYTDIKPWEDWR